MSYSLSIYGRLVESYSLSIYGKLVESYSMSIYGRLVVSYSLSIYGRLVVSYSMSIYGRLVVNYSLSIYVRLVQSGTHQSEYLGQPLPLQVVGEVYDDHRDHGGEGDEDHVNTLVDTEQRHGGGRRGLNQNQEQHKEACEQAHTCRKQSVIIATGSHLQETVGNHSNRLIPAGNRINHKDHNSVRCPKDNRVTIPLTLPSGS